MFDPHTDLNKFKLVTRINETFRQLFARLTPPPDRIARRHERTIVISLIIVLVILRSAVFVFGEQPQFDSDQAIVGLMAKHLSELRALPVFFYGQHFMLGVEAWLAAPLFYLVGPSVAMLKLPLLGINLAVAVLLLLLLERELKLRPAAAGVATLFFVVPPPGTTRLLLEANGGNIEPFLYVLLLWVFRRRPVSFGVILAIGFLNREFTAYGLSALLILEATEGSLFRPANLQRKLLAAVSFIATFQLLQLPKQYGSAAGPGTAVASVTSPGNFQEVLNRACWEPAGVPTWLAETFTTQLARLFADGHEGLWLLVGSMLLFAFARISLSSFGNQKRRWRGELQFGTYLLLVGLQATIVHAALRCGEVSLLRYSLLALLGPVGLSAAYLKVETSRRFRAGILFIISVWTLVSLADHTRFASAHSRAAADPRRVLADYLVSNGIRYGKSDYWTAYHVTFISKEQVILASTDFIRIRKYQRIVDAHSDEAVTITSRQCQGGTEVVPGRYYVCPPGE